MKVVIINGSAGVGKDTFCNICAKKVFVANISSVDEVKEIAKVCGWNGEKDEHSRKFLSDLKAVLTEYNDGPFKYLVQRVKEAKREGMELVFLHIREPEEIMRAREIFDAKTLIIRAPKRVPVVPNNNSDMSVDNYVYDMEICNDNSIYELEYEADCFLSALGLRRN